MTASEDKKVADRFRNNGWYVIDKGWPDLLLWDDEQRVMAIELKRGSDHLSPEQEMMWTLFDSLLGVPFHVAYEEDIEYLLSRKTHGGTAPVHEPIKTVPVLEMKCSQLEKRVETLERENRRLKDFMRSKKNIWEDWKIYSILKGWSRSHG